MLFVLFGSHSIQYRVLLNKIDSIEKGYVRKISKAQLIGASFFELLKDLPKKEQKKFLINNMQWLAKHHPKTHQKFMEKALTGVAHILDDHSTYLSPKTFNNIIQVSQGKIVGIGVELFEKNGMIEVVGVIPSSPADKAHLKVGDLITHINGNEVTPSKEYIVETLRGPVGSKVTVVIQRKDKVFSVEISRNRIPLKAINHSVHQNVLYLQINYFSHTTYHSLKNILIKHSHTRGCILDLRNNPGGIFQQGILVAGLFLNKNIEILRMHTKTGNKIFFSKEKDYLRHKPLVILVNRATASSAEIVAGSLKDAGRAIVIGERTLGKGTVQEMRGIFPSSLFGAFKYTIAEFFTSSGLSIHNNGIEPNVHLSSEMNVIKEGLTRVLHKVTH